MEKFTGTNPEINNIMENNMVETISQNSGTNPETNHNDSAQNETISRKLSRKERKRLGYAQTNLKQKNKKLERLNKEKTDLKDTLNRGYWIIKSEKEGENESSKKTQVNLSSLDRLKIRDNIIDIDIELFELEKRRKTLSTKIVAKREQSIRAKQSILLRKKMAQKQKRNAIFQGEEDLAAAVSTESETESKNIHSSNQEPVIQRRIVQTQSETELPGIQSFEDPLSFMDREETEVIFVKTETVESNQS